jgi:hypothetical protein
MTIPIGTEWTETQVTMNGAFVSYPILRAAVRTAPVNDNPETASFYPYGPQDSFLLREVVIPGATGEDYENLMDQIVTLIDSFVQPFLDADANTSTAKRYFQGPTELIEGS